MTADNQAAGAASPEEEWHAIDWYAVHRNVCRLQARIVKATREGRWGKVKALQHLLTHSLSSATKKRATLMAWPSQGGASGRVGMDLW
jgi:RNA-directed DNA polymerase